jgi:hypothetical protein
MNSERTSTNTKVKQRILYKKERYAIKKTTQDIKEELNKDVESLRKKNQTRMLEIKSFFSQTNKQQQQQQQKTAKGNSSRLEQVEDRISMLEHKIGI